MSTTQQPEATRLVDKYEIEGFLQDHRFAQNEWCRQAVAELRRLHAENQDLRARVQELGEMARENRSKRVIELERLIAEMESEAEQNAKIIGASAETELALRGRIAKLEAARIAYASEFEPDADGDPDVGNIHANIRALKAQLSTVVDSNEEIHEALTACANLLIKTPKITQDLYVGKDRKSWGVQAKAVLDVAVSALIASDAKPLRKPSKERKHDRRR